MQSARPVGPGFSPLDEEWDLAPGRYSPWVLECIVRLGTWLPFEQVPEALAFLARVSVSAETVRRLTEAAGAAQVAIEAATGAELERTNPASPAGPAVLQLSVDGAMVPLVGGEWTEVRTVALGRVVQTETAAGPRFVRTSEMSYFSRQATAEELRSLAWPELYRRGIETAGVVCAVQDGAEWLQSFIAVFRPDAVRILDFPHAAEYLSEAAQAVFGAGTAETKQWLSDQLHELKHGTPKKVLAAVRTLPVARAPLSTSAAAARTKTLTYLTKRRSQIRYARFQEAGYPIGSGVVESANKLVVEARLKGSGMHWAPRNVNPLVALRAVVCSHRWAEAWPQIPTFLRRSARGRTAERRVVRLASRSLTDTRSSPLTPPVIPPPSLPTAPIPPSSPPVTSLPPRPKTIVNGRPTAAHPWKRGYSPGSRAS